MKLRATAAAAAALVGVVALSGCSGDSTDESAASSSAAPGADGGTEAAPSLNNQQGVRKDLTDAKCERDEQGNWSGSGKMTNNSDQDLTFVVTFSVATVEGGSVKGSAVETIDLKAGESKDISKPSFFTSTEEGLQCIVSANSGTK